MMRGKLLKRSDILHRWRTRTFELDLNVLVRTLRYYDENNKLRGELVLNGKECVIELINESIVGRAHCFSLTCENKTFYMAAGSDSSMRKWIDFLQRSGAKLMGVEQNEQQQVWKSVMEAEAKMRDKNSSRLWASQIQLSEAGSFVERKSSSIRDSAESKASTQEERISDRDSGSTIEMIGSSSSLFASGKDGFAQLYCGPCMLPSVFSVLRYKPGKQSFRSREFFMAQGLTEEAVPMAKQIDDIAQRVHQQILDLGLEKVPLPHSLAPAQCNIFVSKELNDYDKLCIFIGSSYSGGVGVPAGIWSRSTCATLGIENGSMISYLKKSIEHDFGNLVLDTATHSNLVEVRGNIQKILVDGSETSEKHISSVWDKFVRVSEAQNVFVIAYGYGGECFKAFLEANPRILTSAKSPRLQAVNFIDSTHRIDHSTNSVVRDFLSRRAINWQPDSKEAFGAQLSEQHEAVKGCICISAGRQESLETGTNPATIIPVVKDASFRYFEFCVDIDCYGDDGSSYSERFANLESRTGLSAW